MSDAESLVRMVIELSPPVSLMLTLNFVMFFAKRTPSIPNWIIPWLSIILGMITYPFISDPNSVGFAVRYPVAVQIITGFLIGAAAVGSHQWFRQTIERFGYKTGYTEFVVNPENKR